MRPIYDALHTESFEPNKELNILRIRDFLTRCCSSWVQGGTLFEVLLLDILPEGQLLSYVLWKPHREVTTCGDWECHHSKTIFLENHLQTTVYSGLTHSPLKAPAALHPPLAKEGT